MGRGSELWHACSVSFGKMLADMGRRMCPGKMGRLFTDQLIVGRGLGMIMLHGILRIRALLVVMGMVLMVVGVGACGFV